MIKEVVLVSEGRQDQGLGEMPLLASAAAESGCGGRAPRTNGASGGFPSVPPGPIAVTVPGLRPGDLAMRSVSPPTQLLQLQLGGQFLSHCIVVAPSVRSSLKLFSRSFGPERHFSRRVSVWVPRSPVLHSLPRAMRRGDQG